MKPYTIGVLGGIGPEATGAFYAGLIARLQSSGTIQRNEDYPRIVINSIPAPELTDDEMTHAQLQPYREGIERLDKESPDLIVMVCNTIHLRYRELQAHASAPILDLRSAVAERLRREGITSLAVVGTKMTLREGLYVFDGITTIAPSEEEIETLMQCIVRFNNGTDREQQCASAQHIVRRLHEAGAQRILLGCTEFALMLAQTDLPTIDTIDVLIDATARQFLQR